MEAGWHEAHRFTSLKDSNPYIGIICRSLLLDSDPINKEMPGLEPIYSINPEALHLLMPEILAHADFSGKYRKIIDAGQGLDHLIGDGLGHPFINQNLRQLNDLVSESIGRQADAIMTHIGTEKCIEQSVYLADPLFPARIRKAIRKTRRHIWRLSMLISDYFANGDIMVEPKRIACAINFAEGIAYRRMSRMAHDEENCIGPEYMHHFSLYNVEKRAPSIFDRFFMRLIVSSPNMAYLIGTQFDEIDRFVRLDFPPDSRIPSMFNEYLKDNAPCNVYDISAILGAGEHFPRHYPVIGRLVTG
jgi:hypothetical protein